LSEHFQKTLHCEKGRRFQIPCQPSGRRVIPSGCPSVHCSIRSDDVFIQTGRQTDQHHPSGRRIFFVRALHYIDKLLFQLASVRTSQQPVRTPINTRTVSDSFQVPIKARSINRSDDVVSRPDARLLKARIAIQISSSGRQSALVRTLAYQLRKLPIPRTHNRYGNCVLKNCRPDVHPPWSGHAKPYTKITCSRRATVWTSVSHRPDAALKQERFLAKFLENPVAQLSVRTA
jgi:hypothetical protein